MLKSFITGQRPFAIFDPANAEHRKYFYKFQHTLSWSDCPVQWGIDDDSTDIVHNISKKLVKFYIEAEFKVKKKTVSKPILKIRKQATQ